MKNILTYLKTLNSEDFKELMSFLSVTTAFIYFFLVTFIDIPQENQRFAGFILGGGWGWWGLFFFVFYRY